MKQLIANHRFCERDVYFVRILHNSEHITIQQIEQILDGMEFEDLTFKFYSDGSLEIICNNSGNKLLPQDLTGESYDFYARKRIENIKSSLKKEKVAV